MENKEKRLIRVWLLEEINQPTPIIGKDWLREKAEELIIRAPLKKKPL